MRFRVLKRLLCGLLLAALLVVFVALMRTSDLSSHLKPSPAADVKATSSQVSMSDVSHPMPVSLADSRHGQLVWQQLPQQQQQQQLLSQQQQQLQQRWASGVPAAEETATSINYLPRDAAPYTTASPWAERKTDYTNLWERILPGVGHGGRPPEHEDIMSTKCTPRHHVLFLKVHKTGSSTVANILQRYGFTRQLNFVLPRRRLHSYSYNYLNTPGQSLTLDMLIPPPSGQHYDILWNHATYDRAFFKRIMPPDTVYISILREPLQQFQSAFEYYGISTRSYLYPILHKNVSNPLSEFLRTPYTNQSYLSYVRNKQAQDFGMKSRHVFSESVRWQYIRQLGEDFHLVMITEYFDESLVLLRRLLCWGVKDILYIPKNMNSRKMTRVFTDEDHANHRKYSAADYELYEFFRQRFEDILKSQDMDFRAEVGYFKDLLQKVQVACSLRGGMKVNSSPWNQHFKVNKQDCQYMLKSELPFLDDIMIDAVRRYQHSFQAGG